MIKYSTTKVAKAMADEKLTVLKDVLLSDEVIISKKRYESLLRAEEELTALEAGGVDNWEWYHESLKNAGLLDDDEDEDEE